MIGGGVARQDRGEAFRAGRHRVENQETVMGEILYRYWQREQGAADPGSSIPAGGVLMAALSAQERLDDTVLRTRLYPAMRVTVSPTRKPTEDWWVRTQVNYVAWFDEGNFVDIPDPFSDDRRIVLTGELTPTFTPQIATPGAYSVIWDTKGQVAESFAKRRFDAQTHNQYGTIFVAMVPYDWTFQIMVANNFTLGIHMTCTSEVLFGSRSHP
jgi:hypothetical protein